MSVSTMAVVSQFEQRTTGTGKTLGSFKDSQGSEYVAFDYPVIRQMEQLQGKTVQVIYDERTKGSFTNRYVKSLLELPTSDQTTYGGNHPRGGSPHSGNGAEAISGLPDDWVENIRVAARRGDWRASEALARQEHIERSVALNNAVQFLQYLDEQDRKVSNIVSIFEYMLSALKG